jgi:hypothetical protein
MDGVLKYDCEHVRSWHLRGMIILAIFNPDPGPGWKPCFVAAEDRRPIPPFQFWREAVNPLLSLPPDPTLSVEMLQNQPPGGALHTSTPFTPDEILARLSVVKSLGGLAARTEARRLEARLAELIASAKGGA